MNPNGRLRPYCHHCGRGVRVIRIVEQRCQQPNAHSQRRLPVPVLPAGARHVQAVGECRHRLNIVTTLGILKEMRGDIRGR